MILGVERYELDTNESRTFSKTTQGGFIMATFPSNGATHIKTVQYYSIYDDFLDSEGGGDSSKQYYIEIKRTTAGGNVTITSRGASAWVTFVKQK